MIKTISISLVVGLLVGVLGTVVLSSGSGLGGTTNFDNLELDSLTVSGASTIGGATTVGGDLTVTTSNTATSTITVGCFQSYATSTATPLSLRFTASTTAPTNGSGVIPVVSYGVCP